MQQIWQHNTTPNGVFGLKYGPKRDDFAAWTASFRRVLNLPERLSTADVWAATFPDCRHVFMTRRHKVRLAVSWWRAIQSGEWHRARGQQPSTPIEAQHATLNDQYSFEAIHHLFVEASLREALIEEFFAEASIHPLTVVYEDFLRDYEGTVRSTLRFLDLEVPAVIPAPALERLADDGSEGWVQRFRHEQQANWTSPAW
ncbi:Stf0 family sulfotransferase [Deinococcus sp. KNUC1210]|uniref:Stf0 family sulfotransferase n=1 Tax=Deinococcus sp. KNUC1210 TaxID=2917691 RepID=UPI00210797AA|nr:Stf0 family sulfotransferase [Deinococcus sp. KNUC1210]